MIESGKLLRLALIWRNNAPMQIPRLLLSVWVAALGLVALSARADDNPAQTPTAAAKSPATTLSKAELRKQAEANAEAFNEAAKKAKAETEAKKKADAKARKETAAKAKTEKRKSAPAGAQAQPEKKGATFKRLETPPVLISSDKTQRLEQLLRKYKADEITPSEYQKERAKVLAEP
jgi:hypothetical protein